MDWYCENVIRGDLPVDIVYESNTVLAFHHIKLFREHHIVIIPKKHIDSVACEDAKNAAL